MDALDAPKGFSVREVAPSTGNLDAQFMRSLQRTAFPGTSISWPSTQTTGKSPAPTLIFTMLVGVNLNGAEILIGRAMEHFTQAIEA